MKHLKVNGVAALLKDGEELGIVCRLNVVPGGFVGYPSR